jgi:hypothetical protein
MIGMNLEENHMFNLPTLITEDSLIKSMNIEALVLNPVAKGVGSLVVLSSDSATEKIVKIYAVEETGNENEYIVGFKLFESAFEDEKYAQEFIEYLPSMSAIELLFVTYDLSNEFTMH